MRRRHSDDQDLTIGGAELLGFAVVVTISACAFLFIGASKPTPVARVASMENVQAVDSETTGSISPASTTVLPADAPIPTLRP